MLVDWSEVSGADVHSTKQVAAALKPYLLSWAELPIHLIGHSRGGSLVSELARLLGQDGVWVDQLTTLDPHPACWVFDDATVNAYTNVLFYDNYYHTDSGSANCWETTAFAGFYVNGACNQVLSGLTGVYPGTNGPHSDVHLWYHGTIDTNLTANDGSYAVPPAWYSGSQGPRNGIGLYYSRIVGGTMSGGTRPTSVGADSGLRLLNAPRVPVTVTAAGDDIWPNIEIVDFTGDKTITQSDAFQVNLFFEDVNRDSTIEVGVDSDANPYNGGTNAISSINTSFLTGNYHEFVYDNSVINLGPGTRYIYAKISNGTHTRYYYARGKLTVTPGVPTLTSGTVTPASGSTGDSYTYSTQYIDPSGSAPLEKKVYVDGSPYDMTLSAGSAANGTYSFAKSNLGTGVHSYRFAFKSASGSSVGFPASGTLSGPTVSSSGGGGNILVYAYSFGESVLGRGGAIAPAYSGAKFAAGDQLWFTALPDFGWQVDYWQMWPTPSSPQPPDYVSPDKLQAEMIVRNTPTDNEIACYFKRIDPNKRILTLTSTGPGSTTPQAGKYAYDVNSSVPLNAAPSSNASFVEWSQGGVQLATNQTYNLTMDSDKSIHAVFAYNDTATYSNDLPCVQDAIVKPFKPQQNTGTGPLAVQYDQTDSTHEQQSVLKFDVSSVPSDAAISRLELHLYCTDYPSSNRKGYEVQRNTSDWSEANIVGLTPSCDNITWGNPPNFGNNVDVWHVVNLSDWIADSLNWIPLWKANNYGLRLRWWRDDVNHQHGDPGQYAFDSRDGGNPPYLRVVYQGRRLIPDISVAPTNIAIQTIKGEMGANAVLSIWNSGEGTLSYAVSASTNWMVLSGETNGTSTNETRQVTVAFDVTNLPLGYYSGTLSVVDPNASNNPVTIPVSLGVLGPGIAVAPTNLLAECLMGENPSGTTIDIRNSGYGTLDFALSNSAQWLVMGQTSGTSTGQTVQVSVQYAVSGLSAGTYADMIQVRDLGGDAPTVNIPVSVTVWEKVATPSFSPLAGRTYTNSVAVTITCATTDAAIHYTLDGSVPTESSPLYSGALVIITDTALLRARAWKTGMLPSEEQMGTYQIITGYQAWQLQYFGCTICSQAAETADADGTGQNNLFKYVAGLDPTNPASVFLFDIGLNSPASVPSDGLVAYYPLDGNANDATSNHKDGVNNGATLTTNRFGSANSAMFFDGTDFIDLQSHPALTGPQTNVSVSAWFSANSTTPYDSIYRHRGDYRDVVFFWSWLGDRTLTWSIDDSAGTEHNVTSGTLQTNTWIHCVGTYDGSVQNLYINGSLVNSLNWAGAMNWSDNFHGEGIGGVAYGPNTKFSGSIDDVRIYNRALSADEVEQLYHTESSQPKGPHLVYSPVATGRTYTPLFSTDLVSPVWSPLTGYVGPVTNGSQITLTDTNAVPPQKFYRIRISLP